MTLSKGTEKKSTRDAFGEALLKAGSAYNDLVVVSADLAESTRLKAFSQKYPQRFIEVGVAEQNMAGVSAGLALAGKRVVMASFGVFSPGRNWEQIRTSICYNRANVKIVATHTGLSPARDGATHEALEDIALMRVLPHMKILSPCDYHETKRALKLALELEGPVYIRLGREATDILTKPQSRLELGKTYKLKEGRKTYVVGTGTVVGEALKAIEKLPKNQQELVGVINVPTIEPLDTESLRKNLGNAEILVSLEEHQITGGLGSLLAEQIAEGYLGKVKLIRVGMPNKFGESGEYGELLEKYGLGAKSLSKTLGALV